MIDYTTHTTHTHTTPKPSTLSNSLRFLNPLALFKPLKQFKPPHTPHTKKTPFQTEPQTLNKKIKYQNKKLFFYFLKNAFCFFSFLSLTCPTLSQSLTLLLSYHLTSLPHDLSTQANDTHNQRRTTNKERKAKPQALPPYLSIILYHDIIILL